MNHDFDDYDAICRKAVKHFWSVRKAQAEKQKASGKQDQGTRGSATGGAQLNGFIDAFKALAQIAGIPDQAIYTSKNMEIPGYFRPNKKWDLLIIRDGVLLAAIETKSQSGSFGNNFNNRIEEALGCAVDLWTAFRENAFERPIRPWLGYLFLLEDSPRSRSSVKTNEPYFPVFPEFKNASYAKRYEIFCKRLVLERHYDATALITTQREEGAKGQYSEPCLDIGFSSFAASFVSHLRGQKT